MLKLWAWLLLGALGLTSYDAFVDRDRRRTQSAPAEEAVVTTFEDGTGLPPPNPPRP
jgi:hypothetical protein